MDFEPLIIETEHPPLLVEIGDHDNDIYYNPRFTNDRRLRKVIYDKVLAARQHLPPHLQFVLYEAYRPRSRQIALWDKIWVQLSAEYPEADDADMTRRCSVFVANPYGVGSGHQFGCAIDITLRHRDTGHDLNMGTAMQEFSERTETASPLITPEQAANRALLVNALEREGLVNYPAEWWHFSYGDRLWAQITGRPETLYGLLPF